MKIGFFTDTYLPAYRGIEISIETFRKEFERMGHKVYVFAQDVPGYTDKNPNVYRFKGFLVNKAPAMRLVVPFWPWSTYQKARSLKLDIVHAHTPLTLGMLGKHIAKKQNIPLVYTHHTRYPELAKLYFKEKVILPNLAVMLCRWFTSRCDTVIAPSLKIKKILRNLYKVNDKIPIDVVLTGIDLSKFKPDQGTRLRIRNKLNIPLDNKVVLFVGSVNRAKNSQFLFNAVSKICNRRKDITLVMVGDGDLRKKLSAAAEKNKLSENIKIIGQVPYQEVVQYYQAADLFAFPSLTDTQGIVLLEAMACGLPVVTLRDDAFAGVVKDAVNGYVVAVRKTSRFAHKIEKILSDHDLYQSFSLAARNTALKFTEEKEAEKLINIYRNLL